MARVVWHAAHEISCRSAPRSPSGLGAPRCVVEHGAHEIFNIFGQPVWCETTWRSCQPLLG
eukprot:1763972-Prymnesium_polylepis.1